MAEHLVCDIESASFSIWMLRNLSPATLADHTRCSNQHSDKIAESAERNEKVKPLDSIARAEDFREEQASRDLRCSGKLSFRDFCCD